MGHSHALPQADAIMSGPTTVIFTAEPATAIIAAATIRAAEAVREGYRQAAALHASHQTDQADRRAAQAAASQQGQAALAERAAAGEQRYAQLCALAAPLGLADSLLSGQPARPADADPLALADYINGLQALCATLELALADSLGQQAVPELGGLEIAASSAAPVPLSPAASARLIARLAGLGPLPQEIEDLAAELDAASGERRELLEVELRRAIQRFQERAVEEASAVILRQSLKDLGYAVEEFSDTLFVDGGVVHFARPGWGDYQVRLRLDAQAGSINFNVVRAVDAGNNERSVLDHLAEDRWCAEFPSLLKALTARGLKLNVTRRLEAGELPVQLVDRAKLPRLAAEETDRPSAAPLYKEIR